MNALAIDLGTTAAKVSVVALDGTILGSGTEPVHTHYGPNDSAQQDPEQIWQAVLGAARHALHDAGTRAAADTRVICATSQWASIVPVDATGKPVGPMVMWLDGRGGRYTKTIAGGEAGHLTRALWSEVHGLHPSASLGHVLYIQNEHPEIHNRTFAYLEPADYLNARFCGCIAATGCTAMPLSLSDNRTLGSPSWSNDLIARAGVDAEKLPEMVRSLSTLGLILAPLANDLGLDPSTVVVAGANDSVAAAIGTNALAPGAGTVVMGTTGVFTAHHPSRIVDLKKFIVTMPSALNDRFYVMAEAGLGAKVLETFLHQVLGADDGLLDSATPPDVFDRLPRVLAEAPVGSDGVLFLPWLIGSMAPKVDGSQRGAFLGLSMGTTRAHMLRAVLEGVSLQMRWLVDEVEASLGVGFSMVRFAGGGAQSAEWSQTMADVLGRPVEQVEGPRLANARGAGLLGFLSIGALELDDLAKSVPIRRRFEPVDANRQLFDERLHVFRDLHARLADPVSRLRIRL